MLERVKNVIEKKINPALMIDGGQVELVGVDDNTVKVKLKGSCAHCAMRIYTLTQFIETTIKKEVPEVKKVIAV